MGLLVGLDCLVGSARPPQQPGAVGERRCGGPYVACIQRGIGRATQLVEAVGVAGVGQREGGGRGCCVVVVLASGRQGSARETPGFFGRASLERLLGSRAIDSTAE